MDIVIKLLFWIHMVSLALGGVAAFGIPVVGMRMPTATAETRPLLFGIANALSNIGRAGIGLLLVTGPLIFWLDFGWVAPNAWFWIKMILVAALLAGVIYAGINAKRAQGGDMAAAKRGPMLGVVTATLFVLVMLSAVFAFA
ncbi:MAG: hypothetical protein HY834_02360 [Devosia nanyangense]|uniref:Uncharacterized protein n=1 Tax=Devosia nanyangense TaxID=1228055 RepID=A0A933KZ88_9HYPH|nr:hypothetical protein [Devosia nanyangense]